MTHSLGAKTLLFAIFPIVIILFGIIVYSAVRMFTEVRAEAESMLQNLAKQVATEIERSNSKAVQAAHLMALAQESGGLFANRPDSMELARRVLKESPEVTGAYYGYEPNADRNDAEITFLATKPTESPAPLTKMADSSPTGTAEKKMTPRFY